MHVCPSACTCVSVRLLDGIVKYALDGINSGLPLATIMASVPVPSELTSLPYLRPAYDDPRWFVATLWRRYCGWYTFDIRHLLPESAANVGTELAHLVGGPAKLAKHAEKLVDQDGPARLGIALEIAELAAAASEQEGDNATIVTAHRVRARVLRALQRRETSLMARSIYRSAARDSEAKVENKSKM